MMPFSIIATLVLGSIFSHVLNDFYFQGCLHELKCKSYWEKNFPGKLNRHDHYIALFMHAFSWTFSIQLPYLIYFDWFASIPFCIMFAVNVIMHMIIDNFKANCSTKNRLSLLEDQILHMAQILITAYELLKHWPYV